MFLTSLKIGNVSKYELQTCGGPSMPGRCSKGVHLCLCFRHRAVDVPVSFEFLDPSGFLQHTSLQQQVRNYKGQTTACGSREGNRKKHLGYLSSKNCAQRQSWFQSLSNYSYVEGKLLGEMYEQSSTHFEEQFLGGLCQRLKGQQPFLLVKCRSLLLRVKLKLISGYVQVMMPH